MYLLKYTQTERPLCPNSDMEGFTLCIVVSSSLLTYIVDNGDEHGRH